MRWRHAQVNNKTVSLSKSPFPTIPPHRRLVLVCSGNGLAWCDAGAYSAGSYGNVSLQIDMTRARGGLPPSLWFALTHGTQDMQSPLVRPMVLQNKNGVEQGQRCIVFSPSSTTTATTLTLCDDDAAYFEMQQPPLTSTVTLGASFWQANTSLVQVDGYTNTITAQTTTAVQPTTDNTALIWQWVGASVALFALIVVFGFWSLGPRLLRFDVYAWHLVHSPEPETWPVHWTTSLGAFLTLPLAAASICIAWIGGQYVHDSAAVPVIGGFDFTWLVASLTGYLGAQMIIGGVSMAVYEIQHAPWPQGCPFLWWWFKTHSTGIRVVWIRQLTQPTSALACGLLALMPLAMVGGDSGEEALCWLLLPFSLILLWIHTTYLVVLMAMGMADPRSNALTVVVALVEFLLLAWFETTMGMLLLRPVFVAGSVFFGPAYVNEGTWLLLSCPVVFATVMLMIMASRVLRLMQEEEEKGRKKK
jgi:hypothetical protein